MVVTAKILSSAIRRALALILIYKRGIDLDDDTTREMNTPAGFGILNASTPLYTLLISPCLDHAADVTKLLSKCLSVTASKKVDVDAGAYADADADADANAEVDSITSGRYSSTLNRTEFGGIAESRHAMRWLEDCTYQQEIFLHMFCRLKMATDFLTVLSQHKLTNRNNSLHLSVISSRSAINAHKIVDNIKGSMIRNAVKIAEYLEVCLQKAEQKGRIHPWILDTIRSLHDLAHRFIL